MLWLLKENDCSLSVTITERLFFFHAHGSASNTARRGETRSPAPRCGFSSARAFAIHRSPTSSLSPGCRRARSTRTSRTRASSRGTSSRSSCFRASTRSRRPAKSARHGRSSSSCSLPSPRTASAPRSSCSSGRRARCPARSTTSSLRTIVQAARLPSRQRCCPGRAPRTDERRPTPVRSHTHGRSTSQPSRRASSRTRRSSARAIRTST